MLGIKVITFFTICNIPRLSFLSLPNQTSPSLPVICKVHVCLQGGETPPPQRVVSSKRVRWKAQHKPKQEEEEGLKKPNFEHKDRGNWIYGDEDFSSELTQEPEGWSEATGDA